MHASHIGITQRPHDHLYQKSGHLGATDISKISKTAKVAKFEYFLLNQNTLPDMLYI